jgi:hypothetical protein
LAPLADPSETAFLLCNDTQDTPMELKIVVKKLIDAFIVKKQLQQMAS